MGLELRRADCVIPPHLFHRLMSISMKGSQPPDVAAFCLIGVMHCLNGLHVGNRRVVYTFSTADSFCFCLNDY